MLERSKAGVAVSGVFEEQDSTTRFSEYPRLKQAGLDVIQDGNPFRMHHKVILIDGRVSMLGSFNFSSNADRENDENLLIVEDPGLTAALEAEFQRVRTQASNPPAPRR
jgi:phosphatidylserine/phosphatidylglycerophosphate/cardiolipin synthase-like enzyme